VVDGNYLFHKTFSIFSSYGTKQPGDVLGNKEDCDMFMRKILTDLCYSLNQVPVTGHIVFVKDSRSWRKNLKIERAEYKGDRKQAEKVNWGNFFDLMDEFGKFLESNNFIYSTAKDAEGDDLLWFWNKKLREEGHNVVIYSGDKDSHQLVDTNDTWTVCWNANSKNNKIFCSQDLREKYLDKEEEMSIFDMDLSGNDEKDKMLKLIESCSLEPVDTEALTFQKILTGDKGDSVPSVFSYEKTPDKIYKVTEKKAESIYDNYKKSGWGNKALKDIWQNDEFKDWIAGYVLRAMSYTDNKENRMIVVKNYHENAQLVWLSDQVIPKEVIASMNESYKATDMKVKGINLDKKTLIGRSKWDTYDAPSSYNPFKNFR
jgi:5'-3' exonuclease